MMIATITPMIEMPNLSPSMVAKIRRLGGILFPNRSANSTVWIFRNAKIAEMPRKTKIKESEKTTRVL